MNLLLALALYTGAVPDAGKPKLVLDGGVDFSDPIYASCPEAPPLVEMDGGWFMPRERASRLACVVTACEVDRRDRERDMKNQPPPPSWMAWVAGLVIAATAGFSVGRSTR